jgi:hypothetical protein
MIFSSNEEDDVQKNGKHFALLCVYNVLIVIMCISIENSAVFYRCVAVSEDAK